MINMKWSRICFPDVLSGCVFWICFPDVLSGCAFQLCFLDVLPGCAFRICFLVVLYGCAFWMCFLVKLPRCAFRMCFLDGRTDGQTDGQTHGRMDGRMDKRTERVTKRVACRRLKKINDNKRKQATKTLILARHGRLECGTNFKGTLSKICKNVKKEMTKTIDWMNVAYWLNPTRPMETINILLFILYSNDNVT